MWPGFAFAVGVPDIGPAVVGADRPESVLVQPEMESGRSPLVNIPPFGGDFQGIRVYRSDVVFLKSAEAKPPRSVHRLDEPAKLSLGMIASPQSPLPFRPAKSL